MLISEETREQLNQLLGETFQMNSFCDNVAYDLDYYVYPQTTEIFHQFVAHKFPEFADQLSDLMIKLNARPIRKALSENTVDYGGDLAKIFEDVDSKFEDYRQKILSVLELVELNEETAELRIALEDFALKFLPYKKQTSVWCTMAKRYEGNYVAFDARIRTFTTFIPISNDKED